jgi:hypothetical protein
MFAHRLRGLIVTAAICISAHTQVGALTWRSAEVRPHPAADSAPAADSQTYPDAAGLRARAERIVRGLASEDLERWRRGYFRSGDPGKYLPTATMARLMVDPQDRQARKLINDDRSPREHYHFAAVNWARFLPLWGDVLTPKTRASLAEHAWNYDAYLNGSGTENHKVMWYASALVVPLFLEGERGIAHRGRAEALADRKEWLRSYVRNLYHYGMGEWESATYHMFSTHSMINVYDFAEDPEVRLLAAAALDYYVGAYSLKYTDGILSGPSQRGYADRPAGQIADQSGWLWWGSTANLPDREVADFRYAMHPATSSWRPNAVISHIARRELPQLPVAVRGSKPNYWFGLNIEPQANVTQETLWISPRYTLGSLWHGYDPHGQTVRWQFTAAGNERGEAAALTGGHPWADRRGGGLGKYDQTMQHEGTLILISRIPEAADLQEEADAAFERALVEGQIERRLEPDPEAGGHPKVTLHVTAVRPEERQAWIANRIKDELAKCPPYIYLSLPEGRAAVQSGDWWFLQVNDAYLALRPLGGSARTGTLAPSDRDSERAERSGQVALGQPALIVDGRHVGFILHTADSSAYKSIGAFAAAVLATSVDDSAFATDMAVSYITPGGRKLRMRYNTAGERAVASIDGKPVDFAHWPVFASPYFSLKGGVLSANDGKQGYVVDFTGEMPVYRAWQPVE